MRERRLRPDEPTAASDEAAACRRGHGLPGGNTAAGAALVTCTATIPVVAN
jgi:hypothetical protein